MGLYAQVPKDPWLAQTNKFQVHEKIQTGFLRFDIDSNAGQRAGSRQSGRSVRPFGAELRWLRVERWWLRRTSRWCRDSRERGCHLF